MRSFVVQRAIQIVLYIFAGIVGLGCILDAISNAIVIITPILTYVSSFVIVVSFFLQHISLKRYPIKWRTRDGNTIFINKIGWTARFTLVGVLLLLWFPRFWSTKENIDSSERKENQSALAHLSDVLERIDKTTQVMLKDSNQRKNLPLVKEDSPVCSIEMPIMFNPEPFNDLFSVFLLNPRASFVANDDPVPKRGARFPICASYDPNTLLSYFDQLPDEALHTELVEVHREKQITFTCDRALHGMAGEHWPADGGVPAHVDIANCGKVRFILPEGAYRNADKITWTPTTAQAGTRQYMIIINNQSGEATTKFKDNLNKEIKSNIQLPGIATVTRYNVNSLETRAIFIFEPLPKQHSVFRTTYATMSIKKLTSFKTISLKLKVDPEDVRMSLMPFLNNIANEKLKTIVATVGEKIDLQMTHDNLDILLLPRGATIEGRNIKWLPREDQLGDQNYIVINKPGTVGYINCDPAKKKCAEVQVGPGVPSVFAVLRIKVNRHVPATKSHDKL